MSRALPAETATGETRGRRTRVRAVLPWGHEEATSHATQKAAHERVEELEKVYAPLIVFDVHGGADLLTMEGRWA